MPTPGSRSISSAPAGSASIRRRPICACAPTTDLTARASSWPRSRARSSSGGSSASSTTTAPIRSGPCALSGCGSRRRATGACGTSPRPEAKANRSPSRSRTSFDPRAARRRAIGPGVPLRRLSDRSPGTRPGAERIPETYRRAQQILARKGIRRAAPMSARDFAAAVAKSLPGEGGQAFAEITEAYLAERFGQRCAVDQRSQLALLEHAVDRMGLRNHAHVR